MANLVLPPSYLSRRSRELREACVTVSGLIDSITQAGTGKRSDPVIERSGEDEQLAHNRRLTGCALGRDLQRNVAMWRGQARQFESAAVGSGPRLMPNAPPKDSAAEDWAATAAAAFAVWADSCDGNDDTPWAELVSQALLAGHREGDVLWVFDDFDRNDGTLRVYEADQMPTIAPNDWKREGARDRRVFPWKEANPAYAPGRKVPKFVPMAQEHGVVRDSRGRVHAYVVCPDHGTDPARYDACSVLAAWNRERNPNGVAKLYKEQWRKSYRGQAIATAVHGIQQDVYEMISHVLQTAKRAHQIAGWTETSLDSGVDPVEQVLLRRGIDPEKVLALAKAQTSEGSTVEIDSIDDLLISRNYENLEKLTGGYWQYPAAGETIHLDRATQPAPEVTPFAQHVQQLSGFAQGLGRSRAMGAAEASYTAYRGEELMSWATFHLYQHRLEKRLLGFVLYKAVSWMVKQRVLPAPPASVRWDTWFTWDWPRMAEVDQLKSAAARRMEQKNGALLFRQMIGPQWEQHFRQYASELELARELGLPLAPFETVAGAMAETPPEEDPPAQE